MLLFLKHAFGVINIEIIYGSWGSPFHNVQYLNENNLFLKNIFTLSKIIFHRRCIMLSLKQFWISTVES